MTIVDGTLYVPDDHPVPGTDLIPWLDEEDIP